MSRRRGEFPNWVKDEALRRANYKCEVCGCTDDLHIHHKVPLALARDLNPEIPVWQLSCPDNAMVVCKKDHPKQDEYSVKNYALMVQILLGLAFQFVLI